MNLAFDFHRLLLEGDESGWIQMLIFAVLIAGSAVSSFVKQRKQRRQIEQEQELRRKPAQPVRREAPSRAVEQQHPAAQRQAQPGPGAQQQARREAAGGAKPRTIIRPGSALSAFVAEIKQEIQRAAEQMQGASPPPPKATAKPQPRKPAEVAQPAFQPEQPKLSLTRKILEDEADLLSVGLPALSGPEDLKRAVLYYEILGKPVSMRGPSEHLIGP